MGLLTPFSVLRGGFLYTMIVPGGGGLLPSSRVPGGMVIDEIDTCIRSEKNQIMCGENPNIRTTKNDHYEIQQPLLQVIQPSKITEKINQYP